MGKFRALGVSERETPVVWAMWLNTDERDVCFPEILTPVRRRLSFLRRTSSVVLRFEDDDEDEDDFRGR